MVKQKRDKLSKAQQELIIKLSHPGIIIDHQHYMGSFQKERFYLVYEGKHMDHLEEKAINPYTFDKLNNLGFLVKFHRTQVNSYYKLRKDWKKVFDKCKV